MIVTKKVLPRRTLLRGLGATVALPLLDAMVPAFAAAAARPVRRLGFIYLANGVSMNGAVNHWRPQGEGAAFELSPILAPLAPFRDQLTVVSGLSHHQAEALGDGNGDHTRGTATWLNGVHPRYTEGADVEAGPTVDQVAAAQIGNATPLPSLELGIDSNFLVGSCENGYSCIYMNTLAWRTATTPLPIENNPRVVFERLFGEGGPPEYRQARLRRTRSILDSVSDELAALRRTLGPSDRTRVADYVEAVREIERRIQQTEATGAASTLPVPDQPMGIPDRFDEHVGLMYDLQWLAYRADLTRVFTFMLGREVSSRTFPEIGVSEPHHGVSHHRDDPTQLETLARINTYQTSLFAAFLEKLRATPDGDGTLLDQTMLLYGAGLSNPNEHSHIDLPLALVGGGAGRLAGGRHLRYPVDTPMTNLLVSILDKAGVRVESLGDSTGRLDLLSGV